MSVVYEIDEERGVIHMAPEGALRVTDILEYFASVTADPAIPKGALELVDFSNVTEFDFSYPRINDITSAYLTMKAQKGIVGTVFLCPSDESFGVARMFEGVTDVASPRPVVHAVRTAEEAEKVIAQIRASG